MHVVGVDLSTHTIDLAKLEENTSRATLLRCELRGRTAWERTRNVRARMPDASWWDDVYLAAVETPYPDQKGVLRRVQGAVLACIPAGVLVWEANAAEWKSALGLKGKPTRDDIARISGSFPLVIAEQEDDQNARDAYCIALWARNTNAAGIAAHLA